MGTAIGAVIDYFVANLPTPMKAVDSSVVVADSLPSKQSRSLVIVGRIAPNSALAADGDQVILSMGSSRREESFAVPCWIECARPGPLQKPSRDAAIALYDVFVHLLTTDPSCGGVLLAGRIAQLGQVSMTQTETDENGMVGDLRVTRFDFQILVKNHYAT